MGSQLAVSMLKPSVTAGHRDHMVAHDHALDVARCYLGEHRFLQRLLGAVLECREYNALAKGGSCIVRIRFCQRFLSTSQRKDEQGYQEPKHRTNSRCTSWQALKRCQFLLYPQRAERKQSQRRRPPPERD